jgi:hypothetical protein
MQASQPFLPIKRGRGMTTRTTKTAVKRTHETKPLFAHTQPPSSTHTRADAGAPHTPSHTRQAYSDTPHTETDRHIRGGGGACEQGNFDVHIESNIEGFTVSLFLHAHNADFFLDRQKAFNHELCCHPSLSRNYRLSKWKVQAQLAEVNRHNILKEPGIGTCVPACTSP